MNFKCHFNGYDGTLVFNHSFTVEENVEPGFWSHITPFPVPDVAPDTVYYITITG